MPIIEKLKHGFFESRYALVVEVDGGEVVLEDAIVCGIREGEVSEVSHVGFGPMGFAFVVVTETTKKGEEAGFGAAEVIDSVSASSA